MKPKQSKFFRLIRWVITIVTKPIKNLWRTEFDENTPAVFVCNHDSSYGPIAMCVYFDLRENISPWINAQALHPGEMPAYIREDFWWPRDKWYTRILDYSLTYLIAPILPLILCGSLCIPVRRDTRVMTTFRGTVDALDKGRHILLFPEKPIDYRVYDEKIQGGFVTIAKMFYRHSGKAVNFYPVYVDWPGKEIRVGAPVPYEPDISLSDMTEKLAKIVEAHFRCKGIDETDKIYGGENL